MEKTEEFPYLYEMHMHSKESSACAVSGAVDMAKAYKEAGYSGMFVTNHNWGGNTCVDRSLPWNVWIDEYFEPYYQAKRWGENNDFKVFCGMETGYGGPEFLIYGLEPQFWHDHPELHDAKVSEQYSIVHDAGGLVFQAHPMRKAWYIDEVRLYPDDVDGIEAFNAAHSSPFSSSHNVKEYNDEAVKYGEEHDFVFIGGSDCHSTNLLYGGMAFKAPVSCSEDFILVMKKYIGRKSETFRNAESYKEYDYVISDGADWYTPFGQRIKRHGGYE